MSGCAAGDAFLLIELPSAAKSRSLLLAQKRPKLWKYARDALGASLAEDPAVAYELGLATLGKLEFKKPRAPRQVD